MPGQRVTLIRNRGFRTVHWDDLLTPASRAAHAGHPMHGRVLPGFERIEISTTAETSTQVLALRNGELDLVYGLGDAAITTANGQLKAEALRDGLRLVREPAPMIPLWMFNMRDPVLGGTTREKIALRRAILMVYDDNEEIRVDGRGFLSQRQQFVPPGIEGYIPGYRNPNHFEPATANALLDRFGYKRGPDGYRRNPDGSELTINALSMSSTASDRRRAEFTKRMLDRIGIRVMFDPVPGFDFNKRMTLCHGMAMMPFVLDFPDGANAMSWFYSKGVGSVNLSCFSDPEFDAAYEKAVVMPTGPARTDLFRTMQSRLDVLALGFNRSMQQIG